MITCTIAITIEDSKITYNWLPQGHRQSPEETRTYERLKAAIALQPP